MALLVEQLILQLKALVIEQLMVPEVQLETMTIQLVILKTQKMPDTN